MLYRDITVMAMLYPEACRHLGLGSEILKIRASEKIYHYWLLIIVLTGTVAAGKHHLLVCGDHRIICMG